MGSRSPPSSRRTVLVHDSGWCSPALSPFLPLSKTGRPLRRNRNCCCDCALARQPLLSQLNQRTRLVEDSVVPAEITGIMKSDGTIGFRAELELSGFD